MPFEKGNKEAAGGRSARGRSTMHIAMRAVYSQSADKDEGGAQENAREFLVKDHAGFVQQLRQLDKDHAARMDELRASKARIAREAKKAALERAAKKQAVPEEIGTDKAIAVCEQWLKDRAAQVKGGVK